MPFLKGTFGTMIGVIIYLLLNKYSFIYYPFIVFVFIIGVKLSDWGEEYFQQKDPGKIVIDEIVGYFITMWNIKTIITFNPFTINNYKIFLLGFLLFRIFDIIKPYPIKRIEKLEKGYGVMLDDVVAGVYANIILIIIIDLHLV